MKAITVFYDVHCGICATVKAWLEREPKYVKLFFVPYDSAHAKELFPKIDDWQPVREILGYGNDAASPQGPARHLVRGVFGGVLLLGRYPGMNREPAPPAYGPGRVNMDHGLALVLGQRGDLRAFPRGRAPIRRVNGGWKKQKNNKDFPHRLHSIMELKAANRFSLLRLIFNNKLC